MPVGRKRPAVYVYTTGSGRVHCRFCGYFRDPRAARGKHVHELAQMDHPLLQHAAVVYGRRALAPGSTCVCEPCMKGAGAAAKRARTAVRPGPYMGMCSSISADAARFPVCDMGALLSPVNLLRAPGRDAVKYVRLSLLTPPASEAASVKPHLNKGGQWATV